jgi:hypothetical protein
VPACSVGKSLIDVGSQNRFHFAVESEPQYEWIGGLLIGRSGWKQKDPRDGAE